MITITSCGELHGPALDHTLLVDLRTALRNPADDPALINMTGLDNPVAQHVINTPGATTLIIDATDEIVADRHTQIVTMCRGGRHRSVVVAEEIARRLRDQGHAVTVEHRDIDKPVVRTN